LAGPAIRIKLASFKIYGFFRLGLNDHLDSWVTTHVANTNAAQKAQASAFQSFIIGKSIIFFDSQFNFLISDCYKKGGCFDSVPPSKRLPLWARPNSDGICR
jgi:hypothetical protein